MIFNLFNIPRDKILLTHLLDFFKSAPRLYEIRLQDSTPDDLDAPPERIVFLPHLKKLETIAKNPNPFLLEHLSIPFGALVVLKFTLWKYSQIGPQVPGTLYNLHNLSHITAVKISVGLSYRAIQLNGPSGELYTCGELNPGATVHYAKATELLQFLNQFDTSRCHQLGITWYRFIQGTLTPITKLIQTGSDRMEVAGPGGGR